MKRVPRTKHFISIENLSKRYDGKAILDSVSLHVEKGQTVCLLGPSGGGKSTLLRCVNGLNTFDAGAIKVGNHQLHSNSKSDLEAVRRTVGMVFQDFRLFPHFSALENVMEAPVRVLKESRTVAKAHAEKLLEEVGLADRMHHRPSQLSGGQQQRVALARAIIIEPDLLLMDEPLGALDRQLRRHVQLEIRRLHEQTRRTTIYVTHDQEEALVMSDRIAVLNGGRLEQIGTPAELYQRPKNVFVAKFLGESNVLPVTVVSREAEAINVRLGSQLFRVPAHSGASERMMAHLLVRPEDLQVAVGDASGIDAEVLETVYLGELSAVRLRLISGELVWMRSMRLSHLRVGERIRVSWEPCTARLLDD